MRKNKLLKNKKADERVLSIYWFVILILITTGVAVSVIMFRGAPVDVRGLETDLLLDKVSNCLVKGGYFVEGINSETDLLDRCSLIFKDSNYEDVSGQYFLKAEVYGFNSGSCAETKDLSECNAEIKFPYVGNSELVELCNNEGKMPVCKQRVVYTLDKTNSKKLLYLLVSIKKIKQNVK